MLFKYRWNKWEILAYFLSPLFLYFSMEFLRAHTMKEFLSCGEDGVMLFLGRMIITYLFLLSVQSIFSILSRPFWGSVLSHILFLVMSTASYLLGFYTGNPLLPNHLFLLGNMGEITGFVELVVTPQMMGGYLLSILFLSGYFYITYRTKKQKIGAEKRHILLSFLLLILCAFNVWNMSLNLPFHQKVLGPLGVANQEFNPWEDYTKNGTVLTFFPRIRRLVADAPEGYSKGKIEEIKAEYDTYEMNTVESEKAPHVIVIQSEALWDPSILPNAKFSVDPMPYIRSLCEKEGGVFVSPALGGGTCLSEFEVLTGYSMDFLPMSAYPYSQYVTGETPSVVDVFRENGYETVGIHTYQKNFYSRNTAYPFLGFDKFIDINDMGEYEVDGAYPSDREMNRQIISAFENRTKDSAFIFAVTMQNHGGYTGKRYGGEWDFSMTADGMSDEDRLGLLDFTQGIRHTDTATRELVEYFESCGEPVILVVYGDHLPLLGTANSTYISGGLLEEGQSSWEVDAMHETPFFVWSNMETDIGAPKAVTGGTVAVNLLKWANLDIPWYYKVMDDFYENYSVLRNGAKAPTGAVGERSLEEMLENYKMIQYDLLSGKEYSRKMN